MDDEMFRHIVEHNERYYIRKFTVSGWKWWDHTDNTWSSRKYNGMATVADLELRWKLKGYQFVQWI